MGIVKDIMVFPSFYYLFEAKKKIKNFLGSPLGRWHA